jgi:hypothetical protein
MANWCSNTVMFTGEQSQLIQLETLFNEMAVKERAENKGQVPPFIEEDGNWLFEISWDFDRLSYETKWSPNIELIKEVATHYGVGFVYDYCETGNCIFGEATLEDGEFRDIFLEPSDFDQYDFDEETDTYTFEGETFESDMEIMEILLDRKRAEAIDL